MSSSSSSAHEINNGHRFNDNEEEEQRIVDELYDLLMQRACVDVACGMHRLVRTGVFPPSGWMVPTSRRDIYPEIHPTEQHVKRSLEHYVVVVPNNSSNKRPKRCNNSTATAAAAKESTNTVELDREDGDGEAFNSSDVDEIMPSNSMMMPPHQTRGFSSSFSSYSSQLDIWGRIPPKEPKTTAQCRICGRHVSTLRFAPHLDKCMGLGNSTTRTAAAAASLVETRSSSSSSAKY